MANMGWALTQLQWGLLGDTQGDLLVKAAIFARFQSTPRRLGRGDSGDEKAHPSKYIYPFCANPAIRQACQKVRTNDYLDEN